MPTLTETQPGHRPSPGPSGSCPLVPFRIPARARYCRACPSSPRSPPRSAGTSSAGSRGSSGCSARHARRAPRLVVLPESAIGGYILEGPARAAPDLPPALAPDGPEIARLAALAGDLGRVRGLHGARRRRPVLDRGVPDRRRRARPPAQGAPAARGALRVQGGRRLRGVRHAGRPDRDAALLRQAVPGGGAGAGARRRRDRVLPGRLVGRPPPPGAARARRPPDAALLRRRPGARGREPGLLRLLQPDRAVGAAEVPRRREGRRPRRRGARAVGARPGMAVARCDLREVRESRMAIDHLADRRPDAYGAR